MAKNSQKYKGEYIFNSDNSTEFFKEYFLPALHHGEIYYDETSQNIVFTTSDYVIKANAKLFNLLYTPSFEGIFEELLTKLSLNPTAEEIASFLEWNNPIFDSIEIKSRKKFMPKIMHKFNPENKEYSEDYVSKFSDELPRALTGIDEKKRVLSINMLLSLNMVDRDDLVSLGYYRNVSVDKLHRMLENGELTEDEVQDIAYFRLLEECAKKDKTSSKKKSLIGLLDKSKVVDLFFNGYISEHELKSSNIHKEDLFNVNYETLITILEEKEKFPRNLQITSKDIIDQYGKSITGTVLYKLMVYGYVKEEDVIDIVGINKILRMTDYDQDLLFEDGEVMAYYSPARMVSMYFSGKLYPEFLEKYNELYSSLNSRSLDEKSKSMLEEMKRHIENDKTIQESEKDNKVQDNILELYRLGLCTKSVFKDSISQEYIEEIYLEGMIETEDIIQFYKDGIISEDVFREYFSDEDIFEMYLNSELQLSILTIIKNRTELYNNIQSAYLENKMPIEDIMSLYFSFNILTISQLDEIVKVAPEDFDISEHITEETGFKKIKELFENYLIDYSAITVLKDQGIISQGEFEEIRETIDKNEFFESLKGRVFKVVTTRQEGKKSRNSSDVIESSSTKPVKKDAFDSEKLLISSLLEIDDIEGETSECGTIESYNKNGHPTTLNGYKVLGNKDNGLVIFSKFEKGNAVFVMPFYQAAFFLRGNESVKGENGEIEISDRMKDKAYLKTLSQVKVVAHTEFFARNLVDSSCELSEVLSEKIKTEDGYIDEVQEFVSLMRSEYRENKGLPSLEIDEKD